MSAEICLRCGQPLKPELARSSAEGFLHYPQCEYQVVRTQVAGTDHTETWDWVTFPSGDRMIYVEVPFNPDHSSHHSYWRVNEKGTRGGRLSGASTVVQTFELNADGLREYQAQLAAKSGRVEPQSWIDKRDLGTRIHIALEDLASGRWPDASGYPESDWPYLAGLTGWWAKRTPEVLAAEQFVMHGDLGYAGRFDLLIRVGDRTQRIDLKTGKLHPYSGAQLIAYDVAAQWCGLPQANEHLLLKLDGEGDFEEVPAFVTHDEFLSAMNVRETAKRVKKLQAERLRT